MKSIKHIIFIFFLFNNTVNSQNNNLEKLRKQFCSTKNYNSYTDNKKLIEKKSKLPPPSPQELDKRKNKLCKLFTIPLKERMKLFPFNNYDSIYVSFPIFH